MIKVCQLGLRSRIPAIRSDLKGKQERTDVGWAMTESHPLERHEDTVQSRNFDDWKWPRL